MRKWIKKVLWVLSICLLLLVGYLGFCSTLYGVHPKTIEFYKNLKEQVKQKGYSPNLVVMSTKRLKLQNEIIRPFGAAKFSQHLYGKAIDILVLDVNGDGQANAKDVDIVYKILDNKIVKNQGGLGSYKGTYGFLSKQMIHLDCRGSRARWNR